MAVPLVLVSNRTKPLDHYRQELSENAAPRIDYIEIAQRLGGEFHGHNLFKAGWYNKVLQLEKRLKLDLLEALFAAANFSKYNAILSTSEKAAIPLSMIISLTRKKKPHVLIGHHFSSENKKRFFRLWDPVKTVSHIIVVCRSQATFVVEKLNYPASQVDFIYDKVDDRFYSPESGPPGDYILAVGQEQRDYDTLLRAISGSNLRLVIVASSPWSTFSVKVPDPKDVTILSHIPFIQLRDLYARARLVVTPLFDVDYAAGANAVLEAMSMGKPLLLSRTAGICDYVVDGVTGRYFSPGEPEELREQIRELWDCPAEQKRLGMNARQAVEESMNMDTYVSRVVQVIEKTLAR
jgi:glycosyltransferase involved in cell wall biosynthesis